MVRPDARILVKSDSTILEASDAALELLGLTLDQLRSLPPGGLSLEADLDASGEFQAAWRDNGGGAVVGAGTARLLDGRLLRVRYLITPYADDTFEVILEESDEPASAPARTYTVGAVLAAWRAAERRLEAIAPGSAEWAAVQAEIEYLRSEYQRVAHLHAERTEN